MIEVQPKLWVGNAEDYEAIKPLTDWAVVHCAKHPWHREALGYKGQGAPKNSPEYLMARRGNRLCLNMIDVDDSKWIHHDMIWGAIKFIDEHIKKHKVLLHCNQGNSRAPGVAMAYMAPGFNCNFETAEQKFIRIYPMCAMRPGIAGYLMDNWEDLCER